MGESDSVGGGDSGGAVNGVKSVTNNKPLGEDDGPSRRRSAVNVVFQKETLETLREPEKVRAAFYLWLKSAVV